MTLKTDSHGKGFCQGLASLFTLLGFMEFNLVADISTLFRRKGPSRLLKSDSPTFANFQSSPPQIVI